MENDPTTGEPFAKKPQPGGFSGSPVKQDDIIVLKKNDKAVKDMLEDKIRADAAVLGLYFNPVTSGNHIPKQGNRIIALAYSSAYSDYHFWRKEDTGKWSHKPELDPATEYDARGRIIWDPQTCDRGIYDRFLGYYEIGPN